MSMAAQDQLDEIEEMEAHPACALELIHKRDSFILAMEHIISTLQTAVIAARETDLPLSRIVKDLKRQQLRTIANAHSSSRSLN